MLWEVAGSVRSLQATSYKQKTTQTQISVYWSRYTHTCKRNKLQQHPGSYTRRVGAVHGLGGGNVST